MSCLIATQALAQPVPFPRPAALKADVAFWVRIYSELETSAGVLHDARALGVIYERLTDLPPEISEARRQLIDQRIADYRERLQFLADGGRARDAEDERVLALWAGRATKVRLQEAAENIRFQSGQADRFRQGLARSGAWRAQIEHMLREAQLPLELAALPHVESAFDPAAYSKVGAAGLWQLMPGTAARYVRVDGQVDERLDPITSTGAAIGYFRDAFARLESWPLALVSYNYGVNGMDRARRQLGTSDVVRILRNYQAPSFRFAARNFYPSFLAVLEVERNAPQLFGPITNRPSWQTCIASVANEVYAASIVSLFGSSVEELQLFNPALRSSVWEGRAPVPVGYALRMPMETLRTAALQAIPANEWASAGGWRAEHAVAPNVYVVQAGDTLTRIATVLGTPSRELIALNRLQRPDLIRAGERLMLSPARHCEECPCRSEPSSNPSLAQASP